MRICSNLQLSLFVFSLYSSHLDYQMQIIYRILLANSSSALVRGIPDTFQSQLCSWEAASPLSLTSKGACPFETRASTFPITLSQHKATSILAQTPCLTDTSVRAPQTLVFCCSYDPRADVT